MQTQTHLQKRLRVAHETPAADSSSLSIEFHATQTVVPRTLQDEFELMASAIDDASHVSDSTTPILGDDALPIDETVFVS
jgi:hypothetical protein